MSYLDRILEVDKALSEKTRAEFDSVIFSSKENAVRAGEALGIKGVFSYTSADEQTCWLPGQDLEQLSEHCESRRKPKDDEEDTPVYKYKNPITQQYYYYQKPGVYKDDDTYLVLVGKSAHILAKALVASFPGS